MTALNRLPIVPAGLGRIVVWLMLAMVGVAVLAGCGGSEEETKPGVALPADFPHDDIPLIDGTVLAASGDRGEGWAITVQGPSNEGNALDAAVTKLTGAGFAEDQRTTQGGQRVVILSKKVDQTTYWTQVGSTSGAAGGPNSVFYQVNVG